MGTSPGPLCTADPALPRSAEGPSERSITGGDPGLCVSGSASPAGTLHGNSCWQQLLPLSAQR